MSEQARIKIEPDLDFVRAVVESDGGRTLKQCFQCGICSVVCNLTPDAAPFPRKEMIWAQWGLKDKLLADPHLWACFQCGDCNVSCPRGARPADVLGALREKVIEALAFPRFMGRVAGDPHSWPLLVLLPALIFGGTMLANSGLQDHSLSAGPIVYGNMISHLQINLVFPFFSALAALAFLVGINRMWKASSGDDLLGFLPQMDIPRMIAAGRGVIGEVLIHHDFDQCDQDRWRKLAHLLVFYAFLGLLATTVLAIVVLVAAEDLHWDRLGAYPLNWYHPVKWLGNASAAALIAGSWIMIQNRRAQAALGKLSSSPHDLFFLYLIFGAGVTGLLAQAFRFLGAPHLVAYSTYFLHLVLVFALLIYSPYSKFAHVAYRTIALIHQRYQELAPAPAGAEAASEAA
jgi:quinone-modifying oxidoreductase, subunit QmoC